MVPSRSLPFNTKNIKQIPKNVFIGEKSLKHDIGWLRKIITKEINGIKVDSSFEPCNIFKIDQTIKYISLIFLGFNTWKDFWILWENSIVRKKESTKNEWRISKQSVFAVCIITEFNIWNNKSTKNKNIKEIC